MIKKHYLDLFVKSKRYFGYNVFHFSQFGHKCKNILHSGILFTDEVRKMILRKNFFSNVSNNKLCFKTLGNFKFSSHMFFLHTV